MGAVKVAGIVLLGHKGSAVEVPFDPAERFGVPPEKLRRGRRGHRVLASASKLRFESEIVPRSKRFWLFVPDTVLTELGLAPGDRIELRVEPGPSSPGAGSLPSKIRPADDRVTPRRGARRSSSGARRRGG